MRFWIYCFKYIGLSLYFCYFPVLQIPVAEGRSTPQERRLLVKVIKANGLGDKDFGMIHKLTLINLLHIGSEYMNVVYV